jgi:hypothetical protein
MVEDTSMSLNNSARYYDIARDAFAAAEDLILQYREMPWGSQSPQDVVNLGKLRTGSSIFDQCFICQVFSAVFVEAEINFFGELALGANYFYSHLDKLDPKSKILVVHRLVYSEEIDKSGQYYENLVTLFRTRNEIVHHKSQPVEKHTIDPELPCSVAKQCFEAARETGHRLVNRPSRPLIFSSEKYEYDYRI